MTQYLVELTNLHREILAGDVCAAPARRALREAPRGAPPSAA